MAKLEVQEKNGTIFCPLKNAWLIAKPEEKVRQRYICTLVNDYGYSLDQMAQEIKVTNSQRGQGKARADIVIWKNKSDKDAKKAAFIVVECKAENVKIHVEDFYQGFNYASWAHAEFFVTTNEKETKFFNVDPAYLPQKLEEVVAIPTAKDVDNAKKIEQLKNQTKTFTREEFTKTLQSCHNIIRNNDKLSPEAAFDEISKLLFMKIRYERQQKGTKVFTKEEYIAQAENYEKNIRPGLKSAGIDQPYMQNLFNTTKVEFKDDHLFEESDEIKIRENSFIQILEKLQNFNLSDTQDDVKGIAFEQFLGTTFRGELGQFFTPRTTLTEVLFMERCLRLLKKGGRMGMVLPEGVLNNKNLQSVREYFEGRAKIILICSIPQDVFIAAGATVKPSLVFMRRFTVDEEAEYARCKTEALAEVTALHQAELDSFENAIAIADSLTDSLKDDLKDAHARLKQAKKDKKNTSSIEVEIATIKQEQVDNKANKKKAEKELKDLKKKISEEVKPVIKKKFDYDIPIAKVDDAGITTTGAASEGNQLPQLVDEYLTYRTQNNLWSDKHLAYEYYQNNDCKYCCSLDGKEVRNL